MGRSVEVVDEDDGFELILRYLLLTDELLDLYQLPHSVKVDLEV